MFDGCLVGVCVCGGYLVGMSGYSVFGRHLAVILVDCG